MKTGRSPIRGDRLLILADKGRVEPSMTSAGNGQRSGRLVLDNRLGWLADAIHGPVEGGIYLLAGSPGIGKSTLSLQLVLSRALVGEPSLYLLSEQSPDDARDRFLGITNALGLSEGAEALLRLVRFESADSTAESLSKCLTRGRKWAWDQNRDLKMLVVDSVQGQGLHGNSKEYRTLLKFCLEVKEEKAAILLLSHITKDGSIAGPRTLEHGVDCVLVLRKAMSYRPLFITKNRYGLTPNVPIPLVLDKESSTLQPSRYSDAVVTQARALIPLSQDVLDAQVCVSLPSTLGTKGSIKTVGIPKKVIEQLLSSTASLVDPDLSDLDFKIQCNVPGSLKYSQYICLAMSVAIVGAYLRRAVPQNAYFIGEVDLAGAIRPIARDVLSSGRWGMPRRDAWPALDSIDSPSKIYCATNSAEQFAGSQLSNGGDVDGETVSFEIFGCDTVKDVIALIWPDLAPDDMAESSA